MKQSRLKRKTPLKASGGPRATKGFKAGAKGLKRSGRLPAKSSRAGKAWVRAFHSTAFLDLVHALPCVRCGQGPSDPHHEPPRSRGGTWLNVSPVCPDCHTLGPDARHRTSAEAFWASVGITAEESNRRVHGLWLDRSLPGPQGEP